jgi:NTP pyrophosphatase (non-canonical NTP hydrolase)
MIDIIENEGIKEDDFIDIEENDKDIVLDSAIQVYGISNQLDMAIEECAELIQAINKIKRNFTIDEIKNIKNGNHIFKSTEDAIVYNNVCSEIADVKIMLYQLEKIFDKNNIDISEERKLIRLEERLLKYKPKNK